MIMKLSVIWCSCALRQTNSNGDSVFSSVDFLQSGICRKETRREEIRVVWIIVQSFYYIMTDALLRLDDGPALRDNKVSMIAVVSKCVCKHPEALFSLESDKEMENVFRWHHLKEKNHLKKENCVTQTINRMALFTNNRNMRTSEASSDFQSWFAGILTTDPVH